MPLGAGEVKPWDPGQHGAGDIAYVAPYLSGLGAMDRGAHSLNETIDLRSLPNV